MLLVRLCIFKNASQLVYDVESVDLSQQVVVVRALFGVRPGLKGQKILGG